MELPRVGRARRWIWVALVLVSLQTVLSMRLRHSFELTASGDLIQCVLLSCLLLVILPNATRSAGRTRLFWALMALGFGTWLAAQGLWTYFEVFLHQEVPNPFVGDVVLFLHIVPMMAALAVQPDIQRDDYLARLGSLDLLLLLIWWLYLYLFAVIPWQYVSLNEEMYGRSFDAAYLTEHLVFLACLILVWRRGVGPWKKIQAHFLGAASLYAVSSIAASVAIDFHLYYTGSLYDVPLIAAMGWFLIATLVGREFLLESGSTPAFDSAPGIWAARLAMVAVFSTPLMIAWSAFGAHIPAAVRSYRIVLTVGVMLVMGVLVVLRQHLLNRELIHLLQDSHQNLDEMRHLKDDLENKEKQLRWQSTELQRKNLELQEVSLTDSLTGVWNRRYLEQTLAAEVGLTLRSWQRAQEADTTSEDLIFIMVDMDFFKRVNDDYGHTIGDELLKKVAERLSKVMRKSDILVRWGGEEFLIMSRSSDRTGTPVFCSRILDVISAEPFHLSNGVRLRKTGSLGWAPYPWCKSAAEAICAEEVVELADWALYEAKSRGKNQSVGFLPSQAATASRGRLTLQNLREDRSNLIEVVASFGAHTAGSADRENLVAARDHFKTPADVSTTARKT